MLVTLGARLLICGTIGDTHDMYRSNGGGGKRAITDHVGNDGGILMNDLRPSIMFDSLICCYTSSSVKVKGNKARTGRRSAAGFTPQTLCR